MPHHCRTRPGIVLVPGLLASLAFAAHSSLAAQSAQALRFAGPILAQPTGVQVPLYSGLGDHRYAITTRRPLAQQYFNQGLRLAWASNRAEALRAFREAERIDSTCAMCAWGIGWALGASVETGRTDNREAARAASHRASELARRVTPRESALIEALHARYFTERSDWSADSAYAAALGDAALAFPDDGELQVLQAESIIAVALAGTGLEAARGLADARTVAGQIVDDVLRRTPEHPGACHLQVHLWLDRDPLQGQACARRLAERAPGAAHFEYLRGLVAVRTGDYTGAVEAARRAITADIPFLDGPATIRDGRLTDAYRPDNWQLLSYAATMSGRRALAVSSAREAAIRSAAPLARAVPVLERTLALPALTLATFGDWTDVLAERLPPSSLPVARGVALYARGLAFAARDRSADADRTLAELRPLRLRARSAADRALLSMAADALNGAIALQRGDARAAVSHYRRAVLEEDRLGNVTPVPVLPPVRGGLGKALLAADAPVQAEAVYREALLQWPENGWSLLGLAESLEAQGRLAEAGLVRARLAIAFAAADIALPVSR